MNPFAFLGTGVLAIISTLTFLFGGSNEDMTEITGLASCPQGMVVQGVHIATRGEGTGAATWHLTNESEGNVAAYAHKVESPQKLGYFVSVGCGMHATTNHFTAGWETTNVTIKIQNVRASVVCRQALTLPSQPTSGYRECTSTSTA